MTGEPKSVAPPPPDRRVRWPFGRPGARGGRSRWRRTVLPRRPTGPRGGFAVVVLSFVLSLGALGQSEPKAGPQPRFRVVDVYVDSGERPLAAYQLTFAARGGEVSIVGIEGGEAAAFRNPPHYDPQAIQQERVIIAAFTTAPVATLPRGRTRVATIHVQVRGTNTPVYQVDRVTAATVKARPINATVRAEERKNP